MKSLPPFDIIAAGLVCVSASVITIYTFILLERQEQPAFLPFAQVEVGEHYYRFLLDQRCVGSLRTNLEEGETARLVVRGDLRLLSRGVLRTAHYAVQSSFNPLGQLFAALAEFRVGEFAATVSAQQVKPIDLKLNASAGDWRSTYTLKVSGPLALMRDTPTTYSLRYPIRRVSSSRGVEEWAHGIVERLNLTIETSDSDCPTSDIGAIPVDNLEGIARSFPLLSGGY
ncbi:MAG: hypothetical protein QY326_04760 [Bdellovibrionota bacterium]|nr:MAG: hypothetical protein QY326_04760 [Bdellovibrionota bacterium]